MAFARDTRDQDSKAVIRKRRYLKRYGGDPIVQFRKFSGRVLYPRSDLDDTQIMEAEGLSHEVFFHMT